MEFHIKTSSTPNNYCQNGKQFCEAAWRCFGGREGRIIENGIIKCLPIPTVVNAAFSCEMNLKALLLLEGKTIPTGRNGHSLQLLFNSLSPERQNLISKFCMPKGATDSFSSFLNILQTHDDDFRQVRYYIENTEWQEMSPMTMLALAENLSTITDVIINQEPK